MPNRNAHLIGGGVAGLAAGLYATRALPEHQRGIEIVSAVVGGLIGGVLPDVLEPATSPNHRAEFHSLVMGMGVGAAATAEWQARCRARALECDGRAALLVEGSPERSSEEAAAFWWRVLAGLLVGFLAGYGSHLVMDFTTTRALPLITNKL
jgi:membrane-bound metal-dependent hydrolase YbcI (DUF457 family)